MPLKSPAAPAAGTSLAVQLRNSLCGAELLSPTREAVARSAEAPGEINSPDAPVAGDDNLSPICARQRRRELHTPAVRAVWGSFGLLQSPPCSRAA